MIAEFKETVCRVNPEYLIVERLENLQVKLGTDCTATVAQPVKGPVAPVHWRIGALV